MSNTLDNRKAKLNPTHHLRMTHRLAQVSRCVSLLFSGPYLYFTWCQCHLFHHFPLEQIPMTGIINDSANLTWFSGRACQMCRVHPIDGPSSLAWTIFLATAKVSNPILSLVSPSQSSGQGTSAGGQGATLEYSLLGLISADKSWSCHGCQAYLLCCLKIFSSLTCSYLFSWLNCS